MTFIGLNEKFTGAGDVRVVTIGTGWVIQLDTGTDGKADLSIEILDRTHSINWGSEDFALA